MYLPQLRCDIFRQGCSAMAMVEVAPAGLLEGNNTDVMVEDAGLAFKGSQASLVLFEY